jgi:hypothetical protein
MRRLTSTAPGATPGMWRLVSTHAPGSAPGMCTSLMATAAPGSAPGMCTSLMATAAPGSTPGMCTSLMATAAPGSTPGMCRASVCFMRAVGVAIGTVIVTAFSVFTALATLSTWKVCCRCVRRFGLGVCEGLRSSLRPLPERI